MQQKQKQTQTTYQNNNILDEVTKVTKLKQKEADISSYLDKEKDNLWKIASDILRETDKERYLGRLALTIANDDNLKNCFKTPAGKLSIVQVMQRAIEMGVMPGDDAYIVAYKESTKVGDQWKEDYIANLQPRSEAYMKICLSEPNPLFTQILHDIVYENDNIEINTGTGNVDHNIKPSKDGRGNIIGAWVKLVPVDKSFIPIVKYWDITRVYSVRDEYSSTWKSYQESVKLFQDCEDGNIKNATKLQNGNYKIPGAGYQGKDKYVNKPENSSNPWNKSLEQMIIKTILKGELKRYALIKPTTAIKKVEKHEEVVEDVKNETIADKADEKLQGALSGFEDVPLEDDKDTPDEIIEDKDKEFFDNIDKS